MDTKKPSPMIKNALLYCFSMALIILLCLGITIHAQTTAAEHLDKHTLTFVNINANSGPLPMSDPNKLKSEKASVLPFRRSEDALTAQREFANAITCGAFVLRTTKSPNFRKIVMPSWNNFRVFGIYYENTVCRNVKLGAGYYVWKQFAPWFNDVSVYSEQTVILGRERGFIQRLNNYKMCDVFGKYYISRGRHQIEAGVGLSYTWGNNTVIDTIYTYPSHDLVFSHREPAKYSGLLTLIGYHYIFFHNRFTIGYEINWRNYFGVYSPYLQNGLTATFRF